MICRALSFFSSEGGQVLCTAADLPQMFGGLLALLAAITVLIWAIWSRRAMAIPGALGAVLGALLLGAAAGLPHWAPDGAQDPGGHVVAILDQSESLRREGDAAYTAKRDLLATRIATFADGLDTMQADWRGSVIGFGAAPQRLARDVPLAALDRAVRAVPLGVPGAASDLAGALQMALDDIADGTGGGRIFVLTDGWATTGVPDAILQRAQALDVAVHVLPHGASRALTGLLAADLGPERYLGDDGVARLTVAGGGQIDWTLDGVGAQTVSVERADAARAVRLPVTFAQRGLRLVEVAYSDAAQAPQSRSLFTLVRGPARVLAYGPAPWLSALPQDAYDVTRADPGNPLDASAFDLAVVDSLTPQDFAAGAVDDLVAAGLGGTGLFLVNSALRGDQRDPQRLKDWEDSSMGPILPVGSDLETYLADPPPREVLIVIDTSGSMGGAPLATAKVLSARIVESLRPIDKLRILTFSGAASELFATNALTLREAARATAILGRMSASGGTNPDDAVRAANTLAGSECHIFFIGDDAGYPDRVQQRPICTLNTYGVAGQKLSSFESDWGAAEALRTPGEAETLDFEMLEPREYDSHWRDGPLTAIPADKETDYPDTLQIGGVARAYLRPESETALITREPPRDPVLVFRHDPQVRALSTAIFLGELDLALNGSARMAATLDTAFQELIGWNDPDLYDIRIRRSGDTFSFTVTALGDQIPAEALALSVDYLDGSFDGIDMRTGPGPGQFSGQGQLDLTDAPSPALLHLVAGGARDQSIPMLLPRAQSETAPLTTTEAQSLGLNVPLLTAILTQTNGVDLTNQSPMMDIRRQDPLEQPLWPLFLGLGLLLISASLFFGGMRR